MGSDNAVVGCYLSGIRQPIRSDWRDKINLPGSARAAAMGASGGECLLPACLSRRRRRSPFFGVGSQEGPTPKNGGQRRGRAFSGLSLGSWPLTLEPEGAGEGSGSPLYGPTCRPVPCWRGGCAAFDVL